MASSCFALGLVALVAAATRGQDAAPVIVELKIDNRPVTSVSQGWVVTAKGRNLHQCPEPVARNHCRHEELRVELDRQPVLLLESTAERVTFIVPQDARIGPTRLTIALRGRGEASIDFDVVDQLPPNPINPGGCVLIEEPIREQFRITRFDLVRDDTGTRFEVSGLAGKLPDGFTLVVTLSCNQRDLAQAMAVVNDEQFAVTFGPYTRELLYGNYAATMLFELRRNPRLLVREFLRGLAPDEAQIYDRIERREFLQIGTPEEVAAQVAAMQANYRLHADDLLGLLGKVEAWRAQPFNPAAYKRWAEGTLVPALKAAFTRHRAFRDATIAPIEPRGELPADALVSIVLETFLQYTRELYQGAKLEVPASLLTVPDVDPFPSAEVSRSHFEAQSRLLMRQIGLR